MYLRVPIILTVSLSRYCESQRVTFTVPKAPPPSAAELDPAPLGISYEFFAFPSYFTNVTATWQCMKNLQALSGTWMPIRIGGTTQDRADYNEKLDAHVSYSVKSPGDAPSILTYGPSFFTLASRYPGRVTIGLNRGHDNIQTTIAAAKRAVLTTNLFALELGNEPECKHAFHYPGRLLNTWFILVGAVNSLDSTSYLESDYPKDGQKIAKNGWNPTTDAHSQGSWQIAIGTAVGKDHIIQASNSLQSPPAWGAVQLLSAQNTTAVSYIKVFSHHNYPGGDIKGLMNHGNIAKNVGSFREDVRRANGVGREYVFGETNSATGGGAAAVSPSFGAALWVADYTLRAVSSNIKRLHFHHGTVGNCQYCWWGRSSMGSPYYGAYFAAAALANGSRIAILDEGRSSYGGYAVYSSVGRLLRIALFNTEYFNGSGVRPIQQFVLNGLDDGVLRSRKLTAPSAGSRADRGQVPSFGGQKFADKTCDIQGERREETVKTEGGSAIVTLGASEALLLDL